MNDEEKPLTAPQERALAVLREHQPLSPKEFALLMWPDSSAWSQRTRGRDRRSGALGGTMAMKGARMLWTLHDLHLALQDHNGQWRTRG